MLELILNPQTVNSEPREFLELALAVVFSVLLSLSFYDKSRALSLTLLYMLLSCASLGWYSLYGPAGVSDIDILAVKHEGLEVWAQIIVLVTLVWAIPSQKLWRVLIGFMLLDCVALQFSHFGLVHGNTFDAAVMICLIPYLLFCEHRFKLFIVPIFLLIAVQFEAKTAFGVLFFQAVAYLWISNRKYLSAASLSGALVAFSALFYTGYRPISEASKRYEFWIQQWKWWAEHGNLITGTGLGSFKRIGTYIRLEGTSISQYIAHNDFWQVLFETGLIGLGLVIACCLWAFREPTESVWSKIILFGMLPFSLFYYPMHTIPSQMIVLLCLKELMQPEIGCITRSSSFRMLFKQEGLCLKRRRKQQRKSHKKR